MKNCDLPNEELYAITQRMVDARRCQVDQEMYVYASGDEFNEIEFDNYLRPLTFCPYVQKLVDECRHRGISLDTER